MSFPGRYLPGLALVAAAAAALWQSVPRIDEDFRFTAAATEVSFWQRGGYRPDPATIGRTIAEAERLVADRPAHPDYLALAADAWVWGGYYEPDRGTALVRVGRGLGLQQASLALRPASLAASRSLERYAVMAGREDVAAGAIAHLAQLRRGLN